MTRTTRTFIDLTDIHGIQFKCERCSTAVTLTLADMKQVPTSCPNCSAYWGRTNRDIRPTSEYIEEFVSTLKAMAKAMEESSLINFNALLEVSSCDKD